MTILLTGGISGSGFHIRKNEPPVWSTPSGSIGSNHEDETVTAQNYAIIATDADDDTLTYSLISGTLPTSATLNSNGTITGPAVAVGSTTVFNFTARVTDGIKNIDRSFFITINDNDAPTWTGGTDADLGDVDEDTAVNIQLTAVDGDALPMELTYSIVSGSLPSGVTMNANGLLSGTAPSVNDNEPFMFTVRADDGQDTADRLFTLTIIDVFVAGNIVEDSVLDFTRFMATGAATTPVAGGTLTLNGGSLSSYDYVIKDGNQTVSSFSAGDWFTNTQDSRTAFVVVKGNLTINVGQTFIPGVRKLFTVIYVTGDLSVNGDISMTGRGANHSGTGSNITAEAIRIADGTYSAVTDPEVPAAGAAGGDNAGAQSFKDGDDGNDGQTGGAGSGAGVGGSASGGNGANGTAFSGGSGGGGRRAAGVSQSGAANGGKGGNGSSAIAGTGAGGGAGNPGGSGADGGQAGQNGTGGILFVITEGQLLGSGNIIAAGMNGGDGVNAPNQSGGGGSGGGSVTVLYGTDGSSITPSAFGGIGGIGSGSSTRGGHGGDGTARKLVL